VNAVAVTADGKRAVSGSSDRTLKVWDLQSGQEERTLSGHAGGVNAVAVTADGKRAVSGSSDRTLKVWDLQSGHCLAMFAADAGMSACAIRDPSQFVAGDALGRVHFLRLVEAEG
jgi:WD40 repeat protein